MQTFDKLPQIYSLPIPEAQQAIEQEISIAKIKTSDPTRFHIRMPGYNSSEHTMRRAEQLIATAREGILSEQIASYDDLYSYVSQRYLLLFRPQSRPAHLTYEQLVSGFNRERGSNNWNYWYAASCTKHEPYEERAMRLIDPSYEEAKAGRYFFSRDYDPHHVMTTNLYGDTAKLVDTRPKWASVAANKSIFIAERRAPTDWLTMKITSDRCEQLTSELFRSAHASGYSAPKESHIPELFKRIGELEWLNGQTWRVQNGVGGIGSIVSKVLGEVHGLDMMGCRPMCDPNLEALVTELPTYTERFMGFVEKIAPLARL